MIDRANVTHAHPVGEWPELIPTRDMGAFFNANTRKIEEAIAKKACEVQTLVRSTYYR